MFNPKCLEMKTMLLILGTALFVTSASSHVNKSLPKSGKTSENPRVVAKLINSMMRPRQGPQVPVVTHQTPTPTPDAVYSTGSASIPMVGPVSGVANGPQPVPTVKGRNCGSGLKVTKRTESETVILLKVKGGNESIVPWQAYVRTLGEDHVHCGGALIGRNWILTAAHCHILPAEKEVFVGINTSPSTSEKGLRIAAVIPHKKFFEEEHQYDFALVRLKERLPAAQAARPVCLPSSGDDFTGDVGMASGWGHMKSENGPYPKKLLIAEMKVLTRRECQQDLNDYNFDMHVSQFCAGSGNAKAQLCYGDSGGPLMVQQLDGRYVLAGIVAAAYR